ncbi:hypothetical protein K438DRAFT_1753862 [Mycena galopus ATCC 62051]|nr:hypothetical protein K438DRAFT_1753862 [Mycena galopus ATCC 62051]
MLNDWQGSASAGLEGVPGARLSSKAAGQELVNVFLKAGGNTIDTSNLYGNGTAQKLIAQLDIKGGHIYTKLFPLLKKLGIWFYGYSPLAGSILVSKNLNVAAKDGSRFHCAVLLILFDTLYWSPAQELREGVSVPGLSLLQVAFRWLQYHSQLDTSKGDKIIIGSYTLEWYQQTLGWTYMPIILSVHLN